MFKPVVWQRLPVQVLVLTAFLLLYIVISIAAPVGGEDAFTIWNMRAKHIGFGTTIVDGLFDQRMAHPDYPPLVSLPIGLIWRLTGFTQAVPIFVHGLIFAGLLVLAYNATTKWMSLVMGAVALFYSNWQYADLLTGALLLGACYFVERRDFRLAGLFVGLNLLTKNEGLFHAVVFTFCLFLLNRSGLRQYLLGVAIPILLLVAFKLLANTPNDVVNAGSITDSLFDVQRYLLIAEYALRLIPVWQRGAITVVILLSLLLRNRVLRFPLSVIGLTSVGYFFIYVITPHDLQWHLDTSFDRLLLHLFPALVFALHPGRSLTEAGITEESKSVVSVEDPAVR